jgi:hypothetical protein
MPTLKNGLVPFYVPTKFFPFFARYHTIAFSVLTFKYSVLNRVPGFLSSHPNWVKPPPHPQESVAPHLWVQGGRHTRLREREWGEPIQNIGQTFWYSRYNVNPLRIQVHIFICDNITNLKRIESYKTCFIRTYFMALAFFK